MKLVKFMAALYAVPTLIVLVVLVAVYAVDPGWLNQTHPQAFEMPLR